MSQIAPFYCLQQLVYHTDDDCPQAQRIPLVDLRVGMGGKADCLCCCHLAKRQISKSLSAQALAGTTRKKPAAYAGQERARMGL